MNQMGKVNTAVKFVSMNGGDWGFDGRDMVILLSSKKARSVAKRFIPKGIVKEEILNGKKTWTCRY